MKIGITVPVYIDNNNHRDSVNDTTRSIYSKWSYTFVPVENHVAEHYSVFKYQFSQQPDELCVLAGRQPQSVAKGWNDGIQKCIDVGCDYILVINQDILLKSDAVNKLVEFTAAHPEYIMTSMGQTPDKWNIEICETDENVSEHPCFSAFMVRPDFFDKMGRFDENILPAYYEDNDMHARMALAHEQAVIYGGARFFHYGSGTLKGDEILRAEMPPKFEANRRYFIRKWGVPNVNEVAQMRATYYEHPFDDPTKTLKDW